MSYSGCKITNLQLTLNEKMVYEEMVRIREETVQIR